MPHKNTSKIATTPIGRNCLTQEMLKECLDYNSNTGIFTWKRRTSNRVKIGDVAGNFSHGYIEISVFSNSYHAHRLAWLWVYGNLPDLFIDHIDGNRSNNRIENLREVSSLGNQQNIRSAQKNSKIGLLGVSHHGKTGKFRARIMADRKLNELGIFDTAEDAHQAYLSAKRQMHETCSI